MLKNHRIDKYHSCHSTSLWLGFLTEVGYDENVRYYYRYYKNIESSAKNLLVVVKYLNGEGFVITAYFVRSIIK